MLSCNSTRAMIGWTAARVPYCHSWMEGDWDLWLVVVL